MELKARQVQRLPGDGRGDVAVETVAERLNHRCDTWPGLASHFEKMEKTELALSWTVLVADLVHTKADLAGFHKALQVVHRRLFGKVPDTQRRMTKRQLDVLEAMRAAVPGSGAVPLSRVFPKSKGGGAAIYHRAVVLVQSGLWPEWRLERRRRELSRKQRAVEERDYRGRVGGATTPKPTLWLVRDPAPTGVRC